MSENVSFGEDLTYTPFEVLDPRFKPLVNGTAKLERLYTGCRWAEGPAWFGAGRYLLWSDIPNNRIMRWDGTDGSVSVYRQPSNNTNGHTVDRQGRLISCEHLGRRVSRTEHDGSITVLADKWNGKRFNSPNDAVVKSDGSIWFTDPAYGIDWDYEGERTESEIGACHVYRIDPQSGAVDTVATDFVRPTALSRPTNEALCRRHRRDACGERASPHPRVRRRQRQDAAWGRSVRDVHGRPVRRIPCGRHRPHLDLGGGRRARVRAGRHDRQDQGARGGGQRLFGELRRNRLFICGTTSLYSYYTLVRGAKTYDIPSSRGAKRRGDPGGWAKGSMAASTPGPWVASLRSQ